MLRLTISNCSSLREFRIHKDCSFCQLYPQWLSPLILIGAHIFNPSQPPSAKAETWWLINGFALMLCCKLRKAALPHSLTTPTRQAKAGARFTIVANSPIGTYDMFTQVGLVTRQTQYETRDRIRTLLYLGRLPPPWLSDFAWLCWLTRRLALICLWLCKAIQGL